MNRPTLHIQMLDSCDFLWFVRRPLCPINIYSGVEPSNSRASLIGSFHRDVALTEYGFSLESIPTLQLDLPLFGGVQ
jgi:hypothetical protein